MKFYEKQRFILQGCGIGTGIGIAGITSFGAESESESLLTRQVESESLQNL